MEKASYNELRRLCVGMKLSPCSGTGITKAVLIAKIDEHNKASKNAKSEPKAAKTGKSRKTQSKKMSSDSPPKHIYENREGVVVFFDVALKPKKGSDWRYLSNFAPARFRYEGVEYVATEQAFMHHKALFFGDEERAAMIIRDGKDFDVNAAIEAMRKGEKGLPVLREWKKNMMVFKRHGRRVVNYDDAKWVKKRYSLMREINRAKFEQNKDLEALLLSTGNSILAEAAPRDPIWGVGKGYAAAKAGPEEWREGALNLQGQLLMEIRDLLMETKNSKE